MTVHRYSTGGFDPFITAAVAALHPDVCDWTDDTLPHHVVDWLDDRAITISDTDRPRARGVMARWWLLATHGGCWLDNDLLPFRRLDQGPPATATLAAQRIGCLVRLPAGHDLAAMMLDHIDATPPGQHRSPDVGGDRVLTALCPPGVARLELPHDATGKLRHRPTWGVHLWATSTLWWKEQHARLPSLEPARP